MKWKKFTIETTTAAEDILIEELYEAGIMGVEIRDRQPLSEEDKAQMFVDILPDLPEDDGVAYLDFYLEDTSREQEIRETVTNIVEGLRSLLDIGSGRITVGETEDKDWINNWKQYFKQFTVDDFLIIPSWEEVKPEDRDKKIIHIDPGTAFGTGMHETTQLCIRQLKKVIHGGEQVLDVGTGSGILSIAALMLGAEHAFGTDLDPCTVSAVQDNKQANAIPEDAFSLVIGDLISDPAVRDAAGYGCYDVVTANILTEVLVKLVPVVVGQMKDGGVCILSGILDEKEDVMTRCVQDAGLTIQEITRQGEWICLTVRK